MSRVPPDVVQAVLDRAGGYCEGCGAIQSGKTDLHHRLLRSRGGGDTVANLMAMHHDCHMNAHLHPARSERLFHMLRTGTNPDTAPPPVAVRNLRSMTA